MNSFDNFSHHHKHVSFDSKRHPEHVLPKLSPLMAQNLVRFATFDGRFCVKKHSLHSYFKFSSGGVNFLAWYLTRFNLNPTDKVSGSLVDHFDPTRISTLGCSCSLFKLQIDQCIAKHVHQKFKQISQSTDQGTSSIRLDLYQTSLLSHILSIWRTFYSMLHFFAPTVCRADLSACKKMHFLGVFARRTPLLLYFIRIKVLQVSFRLFFPIRFVQKLFLDQCGEPDPRDIQLSVRNFAAYWSPEIQSVLFANH